MMRQGHNGGPPLTPLDPKAAGWIAVHRDIRDHPLVGFGKPVKPDDPRRGSHSRNEAWTDLIMECRYQEGRVLNGGKPMTIYAGEMVGAVSWLAHRWNWTPATVRWFLNQLEDDGMITRSQVRPNGERVSTKSDNVKGKQSAIISVCNYFIYQMSAGGEQQSERQSSSNVTTVKQQRSDNNNKEEQGNKGTKGRSARERATRLPNDWVLPKGWGDWALEHFVISAGEVRTEAASFRDYWTGRSGKGSTKVDWEATWRNWIRNSKRNYRQRKPDNAAAPDVTDDLPDDPGYDYEAMRHESGIVVHRGRE